MTFRELTPAKISKKFGINEYYASLKDPYADDIQANTADLMLEKNKMQLSKLSLLQEAKKDYEDGVPVTSYPFLTEQGQDPIEFTQQIENINRQKAEEKFIRSLPMEQQMQIAAMQQYMAQVDQQQQGQQQEAQQQGMLPPAQEQDMQQMPPQGMQMPPPPGMNPQQMAQMGYEVENKDLPIYQNQGEYQPAQRVIETDDGKFIPVSIDPSLMQDITPENRIFLGNDKLRRNYQELEKTFKDPNSPAARALVDKFKEALSNDKYFGRRVKKSHKEQLSNMSEQQIVDYFLMLQKRNLGSYAHELAGGKKIADYKQTGDAKLGTDPELEKMFEQMGLAGQTSGIGGLAQQLGYIAYRDLLKDRDDGLLDERESNALKSFGIRQVGKKDEQYNIDDESDISRADFYLTNTTTGEIAEWSEDHPDAEEYYPDAEEYIEPDPVVEQEDDPINIKPNELKVPYNPNDPRFWLQDLLKLNAIASRKRKKFYPWQPAVADVDVDYVLEDPTRAIAATNEQMNLMAQGLGSFGGPQSFNSRMANVQGKTAANIANVISGVHNRNINTINRGQAQQSQFDYMIDKENRTRKTKLYDDTMKVEQNALIEENFDREQYADALSTAYSNMANTYNMNTLHDNYNIDPTTGGMMYFTNPKALDPSRSNAQSKMEEYTNFLNTFEQQNRRAPTEAEINYFMGIKGQNNASRNNYQQEMYNKNNPGFLKGYDYLGKKGKEVRKLLPFFVGHVGI
jgi:hypothetical protein